MLTLFVPNDLYIEDIVSVDYGYYGDSIYYNTSLGAGVFSQLNKMQVISENYMQNFIVYHHRLLNWKKS